MFDSDRVMVFAPDGSHLKDVVFSARNPTCTAWGGSNWDLLFLASGKDRSSEPRAVDDGGHMFLYKAPDGTRGGPKYEFDG
jgi:sugar lactone lactonase YvrE